MKTVESTNDKEAKTLEEQRNALVKVVSFLLERRWKRLKGQADEESNDAEHRS